MVRRESLRTILFCGLYSDIQPWFKGYLQSGRIINITMSDNINQERRERYLKNLIVEALANVLVEQEQQLPPAPAPQSNSAAPPSSTPPSSETNHAESNPDISETSPEKPEFTVDSMVEKLNVLRGGKSLKDPEVYGKLTTFFNGLSDEQKASFEYMLNQLSEIIVENREQTQQQQPPVDDSSSSQPTPPAPPPAPSPQQSQVANQMVAPVTPGT